MADYQERRQPGARSVAQLCTVLLVATTKAEACGVDLVPQQRSRPAAAGLPVIIWMTWPLAARTSRCGPK